MTPTDFCSQRKCHLNLSWFAQCLNNRPYTLTCHLYEKHPPQRYAAWRGVPEVCTCHMHALSLLPGKVFVTLWHFVHEVYLICYLLYKQDINGLRIMGKPGKSLKFVYGLQSPWIFAYMHGKPAIRSGKLKIIYYLLIRSGSCLCSQCINAWCSKG